MRREILQIKRNDCIGITSDGSSQDMPIMRVGQIQRIDQGFVAGDQRITNMQVHQSTHLLQFLSLVFTLTG